VLIVSALQELNDCDFIFVAVPTPHDPLYAGDKPTAHLPKKDFSYDAVSSVLVQLNDFVNPKKTTIVLISTVLPGTIRREFAPVLKYPLIYNPYLIAMGTVKEDMRNPEMIIIGNETGCIDLRLDALMVIYKNICSTQVRMVTGTWEEAEAVKIFYNTFISAKLSLVNMIQDVAESLGHMNVDVVTKALADSTKRIMSPMYMTAGMGDGGPCHPRDNIALRYLAEQYDLGYDLFDTIMLSRERQAENLAKAILGYGPNVIILGKGYKPNTPLVDGSYSLLVGHYLQKHGGAVQYYDPYTGNTVLEKVDNPVYLIGYISDWVRSFQFVSGSTIVDPWRSLVVTDKTIHVKQYGNTRV
jgi:UDPglucose 6-dehydrogenase